MPGHSIIVRSRGGIVGSGYLLPLLVIQDDTDLVLGYDSTGLLALCYCARLMLMGYFAKAF